MVTPKRMAEVSDDDIVDLGNVTARRGAPAEPFVGRKLARKALAPLAALSVAGLAVGLLLNTPRSDKTEVNNADVAASAMGVSRNEARTAIASPSPSPSVSVTASETPSATPETTPLAEVTPVVEETPTPEPVPTVDYTTVGAEEGTRYTSAGVNVRTGASADFDVVTTLAIGEEVTITDRAIDGWRQVLLSSGSGWVSEQYLTTEKPAAAAAASSGFSTTQCKYSSSVEASLTSRATAAMRAVCGAFPSITSYGGYRAGDSGYHGSGRAIDIMISGEAGWKVAYWAQANAKALGITEVIYQQRIWTTQRSSEGWRWMADRGSVSANHYDHVHLSVTG